MMKYTQLSEQATKKERHQSQKKGPVYAWQIGGIGKKSRNSFLVPNICATEEAAGTEPAVAVLSAKTDAVLDIFITLLV